MLPVLLLPDVEAEAYLHAHQHARFAVFNASATRSVHNHKRVTFSVFKCRDFDVIRNVVNVCHSDVDAGWHQMASTLLGEIVDMANVVSSHGKLCDFGEALKKAGFDLLSLESLVRCGFDGNDQLVHFARTLNYLNIDSKNAVVTSAAQEKFQYLVMQFSEFWRVHQDRAGSDAVIAPDVGELSGYDAIVIGIPRNAYPDPVLKKDIDILLSVAAFVK